jgi:hypothetical protein
VRNRRKAKQLIALEVSELSENKGGLNAHVFDGWFELSDAQRIEAATAGIKFLRTLIPASATATARRLNVT